MGRPAAPGRSEWCRRLCLALITATVFGCASDAPVVAREPEAYDVGAAIAAAARSDDDRARDLGRKPAEVLAFLGVEPGMTAVDLIAAGGWYTEVLSAAVGPEGLVYAQNPAVVLEFRDGANDKALSGRLAENRLPNVRRLDAEITATGLEAGSVDLIVTALNFHDVYNRDPNQAQGLLQVMYGLLKEGGVMGVIDHRGDAGNDNAKLHRMPEADAVSVARSVGFAVQQSDLLANPADDRSKFVFDPSVRGFTDRFVLKLTK